MEADSTSEDELRVVFRIDDSEFRRQLSELRREVEETGREGIGPARPGVPEPPIQVTVAAGAAAVDGGVSEERVKELTDRLDRIESGYGLTMPESRLTVADVERRLRESIERYPVAQKFGLIQEEGVEQYTPMFRDLFDMLGELGGRQGEETQMVGWGDVSDVSTLRFINRIVTEVLPKDLIKKGQFGHEQTLKMFYDRASAAILKGGIGTLGERVFHSGLQKAVETMSREIKGEEVTTGREVILPSGGRLDVGMITDDIIYLSEIKTGEAGLRTAEQVASYMAEYIRQRFMVEERWEGEELPTFADVEDWLPGFLKARRQEGATEPWLKGLVVASKFTGNFDVTLRNILERTGVTRILEEAGELKVATVDVPTEAREYIRRGMSRLPVEGRTDDALSNLWLQWLSGNNQYDIVVDILNTMNIPQERFNQIMAVYAAQYRQEMTDQAARVGIVPGREEIAVGARERLVTDPMRRFGATLTNVRTALRTLVRPGILRRGWEEGGGIEQVVERGVEGIVDWILSDEALTQAIGRGIVTGVPLTEAEEFRQLQQEIWAAEGAPEEPTPPEPVSGDVREVMSQVWRRMQRGEADPLVVARAAAVEAEREEEEEDLIDLVRRVGARREETPARRALSELFREAEEVVAEERAQGISLRDMLGDDVTPVEAMGAALPVDIDIRQYTAKLTKKARRMGLTREEFLTRSTEAETGKLMERITDSYMLSVQGMQRQLAGAGTNEAFVNALKTIFKEETPHVLQRIRGMEEIQADQWTEDLKKIYESVEKGGSMAPIARGDVNTFSYLGQSLRMMEDFEKYTTRLEPATGAFTIAGNTA